MTSVYDSESLAAGYAFDRPPVHRHLLASAPRPARPAARALDIGCGAGVSTAALTPLAEHVVGLEPIPAMLAHRHTVAPRPASPLAQRSGSRSPRPRSTW